MDSFKFCYLEACDHLRVEPNEKILLKIEEAGNSITLNLSAVELTDHTCKAIGLALSKDVFLQELDFSNCMLNDDDLSSILLGVEKNKCLITLNLKGNNIRSIGTEAIGKLLRHNNHLQNLCLEWNGTGIFPEKFSFLCEGLCVNSSLKSLDLRNNQLNHICSQSISDVIYRNSTLQNLDLRWNTIGLIGGRTILKALSRNKSILKLDISGNDVPLEIQNSIELITSVALERYLKNYESVEKTKFFASKFQELEQENTRQLKSLLEQLEIKDKDMCENRRMSSVKLLKLQESLYEKEDAIENLTKRCQEMQKTINLIMEDKHNMALTLNEMEIKYKESKQECQHLLDKERKNKEDTERKLLEDIGSLKEENLFIKQKVQDYMMMQSSSEEQIIKLKSLIIKMEKASEHNEQSFQEQVSSLTEKNQESMRKNDLLRKNEIATLREEYSEIEKNLTQRIKALENRREELEKQIIDKDAKIMEDKACAAKMMDELKIKMKSDEEKLKKQMEDRIALLETSNRKQEALLKEQYQTMYEIKTKCTENDLLFAEEAHRTQQLQLCLENKDAEMEASIAKVKLEVKEQLEELSKTKSLLEDSHSENSNLRQKIEELDKTYKEEIENKDEEIETLKSAIEKQNNKVKEILQNENNRISDLQAAVSSYVNSVKLASNTEEISDPETKLNTAS